DCETIDLSLNGMMVKAPRTVPTGSHVRVSLDMPNGAQPIVGNGSVMRMIGENQMGIQFNLLRTDESGRLQEFLLPLIIEGEIVLALRVVPAHVLRSATYWKSGPA